jgi:hypothetical protein
LDGRKEVVGGREAGEREDVAGREETDEKEEHGIEDVVAKEGIEVIDDELEVRVLGELGKVSVTVVEYPFSLFTCNSVSAAIHCT